MSVEEVADDLESAIERARSWLIELPEGLVRAKPTPDRWSIAEVVGHLVDSACDNHQRFVRAQTVEKLVFPKYDQNDWARINHYHSRVWTEMVELWYQYNRQLAHLIRYVRVGKLQMRCEIAGYDPCTLQFLIEDYLAHLNHHLAKIQERI